MGREPTPAARQARSIRSLPAQPNLEHLKNEAKQRLKALRKANPHAKLANAQLALAREYGFASWRQLKAHVDGSAPANKDRKRVFDAARAGDVETVRRAFDDGFDPGHDRRRWPNNPSDWQGRTGTRPIELLAREFQEQRGASARGTTERSTPSSMPRKPATSTSFAACSMPIPAWSMRAAATTRSRPPCTRPPGSAEPHRSLTGSRACVSCCERGADVRIRDYGDNAYALHFAAESADFEIVKMLVEAGSDVVGDGDDHQLGVLGWATCFREVREDVAEHLLGKGAKLNLWSAIALDRPDDVRAFIARDRSLLNARMSRSEHYRTALHHAAAKNRPRIVQLLIELGADVNATDAVGARR